MRPTQTTHPTIVWKKKNLRQNSPSVQCGWGEATKKKKQNIPTHPEYEEREEVRIVVDCVYLPVNKEGNTILHEIAAPVDL